MSMPIMKGAAGRDSSRLMVSGGEPFARSFIDPCFRFSGWRQKK